MLRKTSEMMEGPGIDIFITGPKGPNNEKDDDDDNNDDDNTDNNNDDDDDDELIQLIKYLTGCTL
jgi:hypothetical protein